MKEDTTIPSWLSEASPGVPRQDSTQHTNVGTPQVRGEASPARTRRDGQVMSTRSGRG
jgi:hypothetical protein